MKNTRLVSILAVIVSAWLTQGAYGSTIGGIVAASGPPVSITGTLQTLSPCVNPQSPTYTGPNTLTFTEGVGPTLLPGTTFKAAFDIDGSSCYPETEYFVTKTITNNTMDTWDDFEIQMKSNDANIECGSTSGLANGAGGPAISGAGPSAAYSCADHQLLNDYDLLAYSGLNVPPGQTISITFALDVCAGCGGGEFFLQQYSGAATAAPEPAPIFLTGGGLIALGLLRRRGARARSISAQA